MRSCPNHSPYIGLGLPLKIPHLWRHTTSPTVSSHLMIPPLNLEMILPLEIIPHGFFKPSTRWHDNPPPFPGRIIHIPHQEDPTYPALRWLHRRPPPPTGGWKDEGVLVLDKNRKYDRWLRWYYVHEILIDR